MPQPITDEDLNVISASLFAGRKIEAIKRYRECAGVGLAEAKISVEKIEADLRTATPTKFQAPAGKGCSTTAAALIAFSLFAIWGAAKLLA
jgi:ribosomal protein L7/L12